MTKERADGVATNPELPFLIRFDNGAHGRFSRLSSDNGDGEPTEYRHGNSPVFYPIKMPGLGRVGNVVMHRGFFVHDDAFRSLVDHVGETSKERLRVVIDLLDGKGIVTTTWTLNNAWPTKIIGAMVMPDGSEEVVTTEQLEIAFEDMIVAAP